MILDFLDVSFSSNQISTTLKKEVDDILVNLTLDNLDDWTLIFKANYKTFFTKSYERNIRQS